MASQSRKHRGYESQRIVAAKFREAGWPYAEPTGAGRQGTDILGVLEVDVEVKARANLDLTGTLNQQAERAVDGILPVAIIRPNGYGPARIDDWPACMKFSTLIRLLKEAGYCPHEP
jgi:hypothetical protein